jgi:hypothetical protein
MHPKNHKSFLFFSSAHLKLWESSQQTKTFTEHLSLVN